VSTHFDGQTGYVPALDYTRLKGQQQRVLAFLSDGKFHTLSEIAKATGTPESTVGSRVRDCRKSKWGSYIVETRRRSKGLWEYKLSAPEVQPRLF